MGEITDALRRARAEKEAQAAESTRADAPSEAEADGRFEAEAAASLRPHRAQAPAHAAPLAPVCEISRERTGFWQARATLVESLGPVAERWRQIALQVRRTLDRRSQRSLIVTSSLREEGKTVTACNLAIALATMAAGRRVALVDLDLRRPSVARALDLRPSEGVETLLAERIPLARVSVPTDVADLVVHPVVSPVADAHRLLAGDRLPEMLAELEREFALVVCDTPPVLPVPDASLIAPHVGGCLLVARAGVTGRNRFQQTIAQLPEDKVLGTLLNDVKSSRRDRYDYYDDYGPGASDE
jgi:capsular exopolysaccharide synthesis family protein